MKAGKIVEQIDRWGTVLLIYLIPWQARFIFSQGYLAGRALASRKRGRFSPSKYLDRGVADCSFCRHDDRKEQDHEEPLLYAPVERPHPVALGRLSALALLSVIVSGDQATTLIAALHLIEGSRYSSWS